jgi:glyoxylate/hydroxypyruvate reductase A
MSAGSRPVLLLIAPLLSADIAAALPSSIRVVVHGQDAYAPGEIDYALAFRPPPGLLASLPKLSVVFSLGAGIDGFLADPSYPRHVPLVRFVDKTLAEEMAQYAVLHTLMFHRNQRTLDAAQANGEWLRVMLDRATRDTRIGILGLGEIGRACAAALLPLGFPVSGWSRTPKTIGGVKSFAGAAALDAFLAQSDILICVLPLTHDTRHLLNAKTFAKLPKGAYVINAARGGHLVERDLITAIDVGHLAGAALDVFEIEPLPESSPLWRHPKIVVTPHVAAISDRAAVARMAADGIARHRRGEPLENIVDLERGY